MNDDCNRCRIRIEWLDVHMRADKAPDFLGQIADREATIDALRTNNSELRSMMAAQTVMIFLHLMKWRSG